VAALVFEEGLAALMRLSRRTRRHLRCSRALTLLSGSEVSARGLRGGGADFASLAEFESLSGWKKKKLLRQKANSF